MHPGAVAAPANFLQPRDLARLHCGVHLVDGDGDGRGRLDEAVHPDQGLLAGGAAAGRVIGRVGDLLLEIAFLHRLDGPPERVYLGEGLEHAALDLVGERLHEVGAAEGIDDAGHPAFLGDDLLGTQGQLHRLLGRNGIGFVESVRVQRLRSP